MFVGQVSAGVKIAEAGDVLSIKHIPVMTFAKHVEGHSALRDVVAVAGIQKRFWAKNLGRIGRSQNLKGFVFHRGRSGEFLVQGNLAGLDMNPIREVMRGSLAEILDRQAHYIFCPPIRLLEFSDHHARYRHVGPQLPSGGVLGTFNQSLGRSPQFPCKYSQPKGEQCEQQFDAVVRPPFARRIMFLFFSYFAGLFIGIRGWKYFDNERRLLGAAFICCGTLLIVCGLTLFILTSFRWSWGWFL